MEDPDTILFVIDEMGIGTKPLRRYGYSHVGTPAVLKRKKALLHNNLSCTACISLFGVEFLQFFSEKGPTNESFENYFDALLTSMKEKYPTKKLCFL